MLQMLDGHVNSRNFNWLLTKRLKPAGSLDDTGLIQHHGGTCNAMRPMRHLGPVTGMRKARQRLEVQVAGCKKST